MTAIAHALARIDPDWLSKFSDRERAVLAYQFDIWLRAEQVVPRSAQLESFGVLAGRGWGKSFGIAIETNRRVREGLCKRPALIAPNEDRVREVQSNFLRAMSPPWFKAEPYGDGIRWPNGVTTEVFTPMAPGRSRSGNFDLVWATELVDWQSTTRWDAFCNITTALRTGAGLLLWDTTSKGKNEIIQFLLREHARDPEANVIRRGTIFDNPVLTRSYIQKEIRKYVKGSRRMREELLGETFDESAGALWQQRWLDDNRISLQPSCDLVIVVIDPSQSDRKDADEAGVCIAGRFNSNHVAILADLSGRQAPEQWAVAAVDRCARDAAGVVYERNNAGDMPRDLIKVHAERRGLRTEVITDDKRPFPSRTPGVIYIRAVTARDSKENRAEAPAALYSDGRVHHLGVHDLLECEQTTWEPGEKSPNRLDATVWAVTELTELRRAEAPRGASAKDIDAAHDLQRRLAESLRGRRFGL